MRYLRDITGIPNSACCPECGSLMQWTATNNGEEYWYCFGWEHIEPPIEESVEILEEAVKNLKNAVENQRERYLSELQRRRELEKRIESLEEEINSR